MLVRKLEEIRLSLWIEEEMQNRFGSKRNAKEEILARYASFIYMGNSQYGFATAAEYYFGRSLATFTADDADKAALLAGIAKSPRYYAPSAKETERVLRRRNQTLALMAANGFISRDSVNSAEQRPIQVIARRKDKMLQAPAVLGTILQELKGRGADLTVENLFQGRIQVYSTVDARVQQIANQALERGLELYEQRHPSAKGIIQGSVVVLRNRDASILAETGGRQFYQDRSAVYSDFNRVTKSLRQPGSTMKPMVYLAAFRQGGFNLETVVPDEPIGVPDGEKQSTKWISNYDEQFRGMIPVREALAESRNAVAIWLTGQIGIASVLGTSRSLGVKTRLQPYATTALGASEVNLLELANAYRTMASGIFAEPYVIRKIVRDSGEVAVDNETGAVCGRCQRLRARAYSGRPARRRAYAHRHGSCTRLQRFPDRGHGQDRDDKRVQRCALCWLDLRPRRNHHRRSCRLRRQSFPRTSRNRRQGCAAGVQRTHAQSVPRKASRAGAGRFRRKWNRTLTIIWQATRSRRENP